MRNGRFGSWGLLLLSEVDILLMDAECLFFSGGARVAADGEGTDRGLGEVQVHSGSLT